ASIAFLHYFESRAEQHRTTFRWRAIVSAATQFALGGLWSAFLIFYTRSSAIVVSWPFLLVLAGILLSNEIFREYHSRLVFTVVLFFIALFSYMTFVVPILVGTINEFTFLISGGCTLLVFALFLGLLAMLGRKRVWDDIGKVTIGALAAFVVINVFYFLNVLPPIPLAMADVGIYQHISHANGGYTATGEPLPWTVKFGQTRVIHLKPGAPLYAYSAVFAPIQLKTKIVHRWQYHDDKKGWVTASTIGFPITGGRDNGYRGFTIKSHPQAGAWRVDIDTVDGRVIGRIGFYVQTVSQEPEMMTKALN
ncbi:MAG TPA: DUF2914 domain-containing protein, partial [Rhizomicrobium sp.]